MSVTYNELYTKLRLRLESAGVASASLEARELVCHAVGIPRADFYRFVMQSADGESVVRLVQLADERIAGKPLAYILGQWDFYGMTFAVSEAVLIPRADSEVLVHAAIEAARGLTGGRRLLDLCSGSGCLGLAALAHLPDWTLTCADISDEALHIARLNADRHALGRRTDLLQVNALDPPPDGLGVYTIMLCNPPYIPFHERDMLDVSVKDYEPHLALFAHQNGLAFYHAVATGWRSVLESGGRLFFECGYNQAGAVSAILKDAGYCAIASFTDTAGIERVVTATMP